MGLTCGIIGLPGVGKSTVFSLLVGQERQGSGKKDAHLGTANIPDSRIDSLAELYKPKKVTYAQMDFTDIAGFAGNIGGGGKTNPFLQQVRGVELLIQVVRAFEDDTHPHIYDTIDPLRDYETTKVELILADLGLIEKRIERIKSGKMKKENQAELEVLERCRATLESEVPLVAMDFSPEEERMLSGYEFLTTKPMMVVVNVDEEGFVQGDYPKKEEFESKLREEGTGYVVISAQIESEIGLLGEEDRAVFMEEMSISESGISRLARAAYERLGLISFFTVGEDEVKAWTIPQDLDARRAAGKIHSDIERGFIRAEVTRFTDLAAEGTIAKCKEKGLTRLEGKDYPVQDGDIITFRFNV
jgi:GTP-binding protein YchF